MITCGTQVVSGSTGGGGDPPPSGTGVVTVSSGAFVSPVASAATTRSTLGLGTAAVAALSDATPIVESGSGSAGTSGDVARADHVHPAAAALTTWLALYGASAFYMGGDAPYGFAQADRLSASAAAASPALGPGQSIVIVLYPGATPTGSEMIIAHTTAAAARGWYVSLGSNAGARTRVGLFFAGLAAGSETSLTGSEAAAGSSYAIAIVVKADKSIRYSVNGGAVQTVAALAGSYTAPTSADTLRIGSPSEFAPTYYPLTSALVAAIRCYSTELTDADAQAACANRALGTIPTVASGTVTHDFSAAAFVGGVRTVVASPAPTWISAGGVAIRPKA